MFGVIMIGKFKVLRIVPIACHPKKVVKKTCKVIEASKHWPAAVAHLSRALDFKVNDYCGANPINIFICAPRVFS